MPEPLNPAFKKVYLAENWIFVPTIASATLAPTVAEASGASALDFSNMIFVDGAPSPTQDTNVGTRRRRLAESSVGQLIGVTTYGGGVLTYQMDPQAATGADGIKLWEKIPEGTTGFLVHRLAVAKATNIAAGQFVDVFPVAFGPSMPVKSGDDEFAEAAATCTYVITSKPAFKVAILA